MAAKVALGGEEDGWHHRFCGKARKSIYIVRTAVCVVVLLLMMGSVAYPAAPEVGEILGKVGSEYNQLQDYHIVALLDNNLRQPDRFHPHHSLITLDVAGQGRVRMTLKGNGLDVLIVSDGKITWHYARKRKLYTEREASAVLETSATQERSADPTPNDLLGQVQNLLIDRLVNLWQLRKGATFLGNDTIEYHGRSTPCYRVVFHLKGLTDQLWIDQKSFLVLQESLIHPLGTAAPQSYVIETVHIKEFDTHAHHSAGFFKFTPPAGTRRVVALDLPGIQEGLVGSPARDFTLPDVEGKQVSLSDFRGKTVLLSFWATWCPPCQRELPTIQRIYEQDRDKHVAVLAVDDESKTTIEKFLKDKHYNFMALVDRKRTLFKRFTVRFIPTVFVINRQGIIIRQIVGWQGPQALLAAVKAGEQ